MDYFFLQRGSSPVDWCESNYVVNSKIAEFFNTVSNGIFFIIPPLMIHFFRDYAKHVTYGIHVIWMLLIIVGAGSVYFHSTLTIAGQLMDELSILWVLMTSFTILFPEKYLPMYFHKNKNQWYTLFSVSTAIITYLCFLKPVLNAYFLMLAFIPPSVMLVFLVRNCNFDKVLRLTRRCVITGIIAVSCWLSDRFHCDFWSNLNFPYLHSIFHILVFYCSYFAIVIFAYFAADYRVPHLKPTISFWPSNKLDYEYLCIPYIKLTPMSFEKKDNTSLVDFKSTSNEMLLEKNRKLVTKEDESNFKLA